jgi:pimeloyl-ACP methyl ester carboxylesterase
VQKKIIWIVCAIPVIIVVMPLIVGDLEKEALNEQTREQLDGEFIELSGGMTHYELKGEKGAKTIVLVHGNAAPYVSWDNTVDALVEAGFRVLRYDVFGHGFSDRPDLDKYNRDLYDQQLVELLAELAITSPVYMAGTSQGGSISIYFAARHPGRVEKLALLSPFFDSFEDTRGAALLKTPIIGEYIIRLVGDKTLIDPSEGLYAEGKKSALISKLKEQLRYKGKKRAVLANLRGNALNDATEFYVEVKKQGIPMLLTWGKQDRSISGESMSKLRELMPTIEYHEFENAAHLAHYEFPERINPVLIKFFNS